MKIDHDRLKALLVSRSIRACVFAANSGLSPSAISNILRGYQPIGPKTFEKIKLGLVHCGIPLSEALSYIVIHNNSIIESTEVRK